MKILKISLVILGLFTLWGCGSSNPEPHTPTSETTEKSAEKKKILALGDSLTEGYRVDRAEAYPSQLQNLIDQNNYAYEVVNSGISGETTTGLSERLNWTLSQNPDIIILTSGANDAMRGIDLDITKQNLQTIIEKIRGKNITLIFGGMQMYENLGADYIQEFKDLYPAIATQYDLPFIPFFLDGVAGNPALNIDDQIHPNKDGYAIIVEQNIWPVLEPLLEK